MTHDNSEIIRDIIGPFFGFAKDIITNIAGPPTEELGKIFADQVKYYRFNNQIRILFNASKKLKDKGIDPRAVPLKTLVPLLESASFEEDESMSDRWASLLATAADSKTADTILPSFTEILKELSPIEAKILDEIYNVIITTPIQKDERASHGAVGKSIKQVFHLSDENYEISIDNLYRLGLCTPPSTKLGFIDHQEHKFQLNMKDIVCLTSLGYAFVSACRYGR